MADIGINHLTVVPQNAEEKGIIDDSDNTDDE